MGEDAGGPTNEGVLEAEKAGRGRVTVVRYKAVGRSRVYEEGVGCGKERDDGKTGGENSIENP